MPKRQAILLILMGLAVIYAAFTLIGGDSTASTPRTTAKDFTELLEGVKKSTELNALTEVEEHRITLLSGEESPDPLLKRDPIQGDADSTARQGDTRFVYSGFLRIGAKRLAVINNSEYSEGELVDETGYTLLTIAPGQVTLEGRSAENGGTDKVAIPIQEDIISFVEDKNEQ
ncbi:MAG: general secretion pathway protein GspB [Proteobacteria bacterium]|nr:general secretion pathway protein GspB [Pseudomonadota bacterium]